MAPTLSPVHVHQVRPEHVHVAAKLDHAWVNIGPVTLHADSLDQLAAIGEQITLMARRAKAQELLANAPFRGDAA